MEYNTNVLSLTFKSTYHNGWPFAKVAINNETVVDKEIVDRDTIDITIVNSNQVCTITIDRYGKLDNQLYCNQVLELESLTVDKIEIPEFLIQSFSKFEFNDQVHYGSKYFAPNGKWTFSFKSPIITWILDQKIIHEAKYSQDYQFDWSFKLGPDSVCTLQKEYLDTLEKINQIYD